ncbi:U3 small nucleolar RNA-associated protein [Trametopsis cervina]|nr:U3 small nucleolar RNA-associated protein [Trametopsis cervina]
MSTVAKSKLKTAFKKARVVAPLYTGGPVAVTPDGNRLVTCVGEEAILTDVQEGREICRFVGDTESITSMCISPSAAHLILFTSAHALRIYELPKENAHITRPVQPIRVVSRAHDAPVHVCRTDPTSTYLASGSADGVVKVWDIVRGYVTHVFKGHGGVVSALVFDYPFDPSSVGREQKMRLVTGCVDTKIRIFDLSAAAARSGAAVKPEAVLEGHVSVPRGLDVSRDGKWLVSGGRDSVVLVWDISSKPADASSAKSSKAKGKAKDGAPQLVKTIPVLERVEAVGLIRQDDDLLGQSSGSTKLQIYTAGEKGVVKVWDARKGSVLYTLGEELDAPTGDQEEQRQIVDALYVPSTSTVVSIHADQNILFHSLSTRSLTRQLIGFNDEIVDVALLSPHHSPPSTGASPDATSNTADTHVALATNSSLIRVYSTSTLDARLLSGHSEIVLCLDHGAQGRVLASGSKDRSARLWAPISSQNTSSTDSPPAVPEWGCVAVCEGHAESVGAIALSRGTATDKSKLGFMFTGSQDRTLKMWDLSSVPLEYGSGSEPQKCKSLTTHKAHDKDINSLDVAPNNRLLVSGSQDRTAKIWEIEYIAYDSGVVRGEIKLLGTCKGHKRGVWTVRFGRTERVLATGSGDKTVKLWSLDDYTCVKTFEGHTNSVLRVDFINAGMQLVSAASDGLVKLWNVRDESCAATMDNHEDKVWALAVSSDEKTIVSGAADSVLTFWEDCTAEQEHEKETKRAEMVLREQDFQNYLSLHDYRNAILLAIAMDQPGRLHTLFKNLPSTTDPLMASLTITGHPSVDEVIRTLGGSDLAKLLRYVKAWNANARTSDVAQRVLHAVVKLRAAEDIAAAFGEENALSVFSEMADASEAPRAKENKGASALRELIEALVPYTERHLARMEKLVQDSYMVDYLLGEMDDGRFSDDEEEEEAMDMQLMEVDTAIELVA